jgi:DNA-binding SARP family transcriptional activator/tetratricopeptide (TPR) repeat protein
MEFRILGALEVLEGERQIPLGAGKQRAVLALLLLHANEVVATERLIDELWGESPPVTARKALQIYISRLRKTLGAERITTREPGYVLELAQDELDLHGFERLVREGGRARAEGNLTRAATLLHQALDLCRGPALADFTYEPFAQAEIARLEELRMSGIEERTDTELAFGHAAQLVGELEALVARHPFRERFRGQLMLALYRSGRQADALAVYHETRKLLVDELGIEPSPALQRLEVAILRQEPALDVAATAKPDLAVDEAKPAREVRKTVTVAAFGLAPPVETLDPEAFRRLRRQLVTTVSQTATRYEGTMVDGETGESLVAAFGIPMLHEDDALRAVRAVFELREQELPLRAGVATGEVVVVGDRAEVELLGTEVGQTAARLRDTAEGNEIVLSEATRRLVRDAVRMEPVGLGWRALELVSGAPSGGGHPETALVGRHDELAQLHHSLRRAAHERTVHLVTVIGVAGIGKSRLVREFASIVGEEATVLTGRCLSYGEGITFWPLREIVEEAAGAATRETVLELMSGADDAAPVADRIAAALGLAELGGTSEEEIFWAVRRLLETLTRGRPLVVVLEDLHWAEPTLLDLVEHLAEWTRDAPLILVCLARPDLLEERPLWGGGKPNAASLRLVPLAADESVTLLSELPGGSRLDEETRVRIAHAAEGNPLFLEQLFALVKEGVELGDEPPVPPTIAALLAARLDRLGPAELGVLEAASIVGREFWPEAVTELLPVEARPSIARHLGTLVRKEFIRLLPSSAAGRETFQFGHVLIQQAAYRAILKERRAEHHERFAAWLTGTAGVRLGELDEIAGYHLERAFRYREELGPVDQARALARAAAERLGAAGLRARARSDETAAVNLLGRAVALLEEDDPTRHGLLPELAGALHEAGESARMETVLGEALEAAETSGDRRLEAYVLIQRGFFLRRMGGESDEALALAERTIPLFEALRDDLGLARTWRLIGEAELALGRSERAGEAWERGLEHARKAGDWREEAELLVWLGLGLVSGPTAVSEALPRLDEILDEGRGDPRVTSLVAIMRAHPVAMQGRFEEARELISRGQATLEELGLTVDAAMVPANFLGEVELLAGDPAAAEAALRRGVEALERMGEKAYLAFLATLLAEALYAEERYEDALELARASESAAAQDDVFSQVGWRSTRAKVLARRGAGDEAVRLAREAVALAEQTDSLDLYGKALSALAEVLDDRPAEAASALASAVAVYEQRENDVLAARARAARDELLRRRVSGTRPPTTRAETT